ncbi:hypothetical protein CC2G_013389 [Coprinopsis cinerea AmutBmut pab1-1]|nr:hypothetical protein CC2G_013389 [Coprinopsis cinerea AmutBmut pab1-1]
MSSTASELPSQHSKILSEPVVILGTGAAGLIHAHVLLQDGFTDVTLISRDESVGGVWSKERVYPGLHINNVHGEYRFSPLKMPPPENADKTGGRLRGEDMCEYMERFANEFLEGKAKFVMRTEVLDVRRIEGPRSPEGHSDSDGWNPLNPWPWHVKVKNLDSDVEEMLHFARVVLATGVSPSVRHIVSRSSSPSAKPRYDYQKFWPPCMVHNFL